MTGLLGKFGNFLNNTALPHIQGLQGDPMFNLGVGLLANSGPHRGPKRSFGQVLAGAQQYANDTQSQFNALQHQRGLLQQQQQQNQAIKKFQGLLQQPPASSVPPSIRRPGAVQNQQNQMMGLLGQIAPGQMAQQMIAQQFAQPQQARVSTDLNTFRALNPNIVPGSQQEREAFREFVASQDPTGQLMQRAELELTLQQLQERRDEQTAEEQERNANRTALIRSVSTDVAKLRELARLNESLKGTVLETGLPLSDLRRGATGTVQAIQSAFGVDDTAARKIKSDFDTLNKLSQDFVIGSLDKFNQTGSVSNQKFQALIQSNAGINSSPETNDFIIANNLEAILAGADAEGIEVNDRAELEELIQQLRAPQSTSTELPQGFTLDE